MKQYPHPSHIEENTVVLSSVLTIVIKCAATMAQTQQRNHSDEGNTASLSGPIIEPFSIKFGLVSPSDRDMTKYEEDTTAGDRKLLHLRPQAADEVDFDITQPPTEPMIPPGKELLVSVEAEPTINDVLLGRGGATNAHTGNRLFRSLVSEFRPLYLTLPRKYKRSLARTIVIIVRRRGGRFLRRVGEGDCRDGNDYLYEVGDQKAESKTAQALREGLSVRATTIEIRRSSHKRGEEKKIEPTDDGYDKEDKNNGFYDRGSVSSIGRREGPPPAVAPPTSPSFDYESSWRMRWYRNDTVSDEQGVYPSLSSHHSDPREMAEEGAAAHHAYGSGLEKESAYENGRHRRAHPSYPRRAGSSERSYSRYSYPYHRPRPEEEDAWIGAGREATVDRPDVSSQSRYYSSEQHYIEYYGSDHHHHSIPSIPRSYNHDGYGYTHSRSLPVAVKSPPSSVPHHTDPSRCGWSGREYHSWSYSDRGCDDGYRGGYGYGHAPSSSADSTARLTLQTSSSGGGGDDAPSRPFPNPSSPESSTSYHHGRPGLDRHYYRPIPYVANAVGDEGGATTGDSRPEGEGQWNRIAPSFTAKGKGFDDGRATRGSFEYGGIDSTPSSFSSWRNTAVFVPAEDGEGVEVTMTAAPSTWAEV